MFFPQLKFPSLNKTSFMEGDVIRSYQDHFFPLQWVEALNHKKTGTATLENSN